MADKTCDTCVCKPVCMDFWKSNRCGDMLHWRGDDAALTSALAKAERKLVNYVDDIAQVEKDRAEYRKDNADLTAALAEAERERDHCIEVCAVALGSEFRNVGVVEACARVASRSLEVDHEDV